MLTHKIIPIWDVGEFAMKLSHKVGNISTSLVVIWSKQRIGKSHSSCHLESYKIGPSSEIDIYVPHESISLRRNV